MGHEFQALRFPAGKLAEGLATAEVAEADLREELKRGADSLVAFAGARGEVVARSKVEEGLSGGHFQELIDRFS